MRECEYRNPAWGFARRRPHDPSLWGGSGQHRRLCALDALQILAGKHVPGLWVSILTHDLTWHFLAPGNQSQGQSLQRAWLGTETHPARTWGSQEPVGSLGMAAGQPT